MDKETLFKKAQTVMPGGVSSPVRSFKSVGGTPPFISEGKGAFLKDTQNKKYIDFVGSYGPAVLGHSNHAVTGAIKKQVEKGLCFGAPSVLEIELADLIIDAIDSIEKVRFTNSGTEAAHTAAALSLGCLCAAPDRSNMKSSLPDLIGRIHRHAIGKQACDFVGSVVLGRSEDCAKALHRCLCSFGVALV